MTAILYPSYTNIHMSQGHPCHGKQDIRLQNIDIITFQPVAIIYTIQMMM